MRSYTTDKRRVDKFEPEIKRILGETFIGTADLETDRKQATDLLVFSLKPLTVACRVRTHGYLDNFGDEFTIRYQRYNGTKTEFGKIVDGWCDYGFYAFADKEDETLVKWTVYRYDTFRATLIRKPEIVSEAIQDNDDGSSSFLAFKWAQFPSEMIVLEGSSTITVPEPVFDATPDLILPTVAP